MKISVVITVYNKSKLHISECIKSVLQQTLRANEYEIIIVDDCSDLAESLGVVEYFENSISRIQVIRHTVNLGPNEARRTGVKAAVGDYVVFVDGDDVLTSDAIESLRIQALRTNADVVLSCFFRWNSLNQTYEKLAIHGSPLPMDYDKRLETFFSGNSSFTMCGRLIRRTLLSDDIFEMPRVFHEDMVAFGRIIFKADKVSVINKHIYYYRWNPGSITSKVTPQHLDGLFLAIGEWYRQAQRYGLSDILATALSIKSAMNLNLAVRRVLHTTDDDLARGYETLKTLWERLREIPRGVVEESERPALKLLKELFGGTATSLPEDILALRERHGLANTPAQYNSEAILPEGLKQSGMACRLAGAVVIVCQVDYHVRSAAHFITALREYGYRALVMDNSSFVANGTRQATEKDRSGIFNSEYIQIKKGPYSADWLATAALVITFNDFNEDFREALELRRLLGLRTVCAVEGINDFLRIDFNEPRYLPYRRCDTVFLAGANDAPFFSDRETHVTGLPSIEVLVEKTPEFPRVPLAVLNVNFTYDALEHCRDSFVAAAADGFAQIGMQWVITQHPMDKGSLARMPVSKLTQYELIDAGSVFVSRFATGILEALASGKPAIYFNPHGEQVSKFQDPKGAFEIANNTRELVEALKITLADIESGVDFRNRALPFLKHHTGYLHDEHTSEHRFAEAVDLILTNPLGSNLNFVKNYDCTNTLQKTNTPSTGIEPFDKSLYAVAFETADSIQKNLKKTGIDVSIIIPCYNGEAFLPICLESLKHQTLSQDCFEVICVDDCSTDNSHQILREYQGQIKNFHIIQHSENRKQGAARNTGLDSATGRYVFFLDSDDFLRIDALELMVNQIGSSEALICQHMTTRFDKPFRAKKSNRHVKSTITLAALENTIGWWPFGILILRDLVERSKIRFREGVYWEDIDFNIQIFLNAKSYHISKEILYYYIQRDNSTVNTIDKKKVIDSVLAIYQVEKNLINTVPAADLQKFRINASNWLRYQSRRLRDSANTQKEKIQLADVFIDDLRATGLLTVLDSGLEEYIRETALDQPVIKNTTKDVTSKDFHYTPWKHDFKNDFKGRVIFFCEVDYHIRSAVSIVRMLNQFGIKSIVIDASKSTCFSSNRPLSEKELRSYPDIDIRHFNVAEVTPFSTDASAFIFMNDLTYTRQLILENFGFGVPTIGFYEGINDDWNLDRLSPRMPYRSTDYLLLPGIYQQGFYADRECRIVGLPNVRSRLAMPYIVPSTRRAIINVNFTYGVLEDRRDEYVETAVNACNDLGLDYVITQHPADKADLSRFNVAQQSVYALLDEGTVLISRFSTTILEALATGRPVVYHNPIAEKVPKFHQPLGAFSTSDSIASLKKALQNELDFIDKGGDVRARAALFLHFHCHTAALEEPSELAAKAIADVLANHPPRFAFKTREFNYLGPQAPAISEEKSPHSPSQSTSKSNYKLQANLKEANRMMRLGEFDTAIRMYLHLYSINPLQIYTDNALLSAKKLGMSELTSIEDLKRNFTE
nr:glycosyltransferase family 2 protein [uncultured Desulfobulbus sp.]